MARSEFRAHGRSLLLSLSGKRTLGMHSTTLDITGERRSHPQTFSYSYQLSFARHDGAPTQL